VGALIRLWEKQGHPYHQTRADYYEELRLIRIIEATK